jgi:formiminoglutamase
MGKFIVTTAEDLAGLISKREGETKLGESVQTIHSPDWEAELNSSDAKFVLLGIPEDIGVRANYGVGGTHTLWPNALRALLNVQDTKKISGKCLLVLGAFDFANKMAQSQDADISSLRSLVDYIDQTVAPLIAAIIRAKKIPIVIGGGHNNAFPLLQGAYMARGEKPINCINLDAHSDFREMEGRHSGNGFRYAHRAGYLDKYAIVGLHENYNAQNVIDELVDDPDIHFSYYEDIFLREDKSFYEAITDAIDHTSGRPTGLELDLDCIERTLSSATSPCGISTLEARQYITWCARKVHPCYLHITEGATQLTDGRTDATTAKLVAYLITDFMKAYLKK